MEIADSVISLKYDDEDDDDDEDGEDGVDGEEEEEEEDDDDDEEDDDDDDDDDFDNNVDDVLPCLSLFGISGSGVLLHKIERKQSNSSSSLDSSCNNVKSFLKQLEFRINRRRMKSHFSALDLSNR